MLRLTCGRDGERGAVAMIVAMLFGFGVMIGLAALTVDVGNINADRRQLQNGADAVALAVAQQCVKDGTCVPTDPKLQDLANGIQRQVAEAQRQINLRDDLLSDARAQYDRTIDARVRRLAGAARRTVSPGGKS